jgi:hypothetical protein
MQIRSLLAVLAASSAACGCAVPPDDPGSAQQARPEPTVRTGSRLPGTGSGMTGNISKDDYQDQRSRSGGAAERFK